MEQNDIGIAVAKGVKGAIQEFLAPDIRTIINELKHHSKQLDQHGQKLDDLTESIHQLDVKQGEILTTLKFEERLDRVEAAIPRRPRGTVRKVYSF